MARRPTILSVVGARPQFIKLAPLAKPLAKRFRHRILHTGQHFDDNMSRVFFRQLKLPRPHLNLKIGGGTHGRMTGRMLTQIERVLIADRPDALVVYGDTNSTLAGALAAAKLEIPIAHVEAGMRSGVMTQPEEINRIVADRLASALFCASPSSVENLRREGMTDGVVLSGDVMHELLVGVKPRLKASGGVLGRYGLEPGGFALMTVHRASNVDDPDNLAKLLDILASVDLPVLLPLHPRTRDRLRRFRLTRTLNRLGNVVVVEPLGYFDTLAAARHARVVFTDSGGLQKEALYLGTPVLVMRDETEWVETLKQGNYLVGLDQRRIAPLLKRRLKARPPGYRVRGRRPSEIIVSGLAALLARS